MAQYSERIRALISAFKKLPGIGERSAERIVLHLLKSKSDEVLELAELIAVAKRETRFCKACGNFAEELLCAICRDAGRDHTTICVVQEPRDIERMERAGRYRGVYHVLFGLLSPLEGIGPKELRIRELTDRIRRSRVQEVIIATAANADGETTAAFLTEYLEPAGIRLTRLARGLPFGGTLEFADEETLGSALEYRHLVRPSKP